MRVLFLSILLLLPVMAPAQDRLTVATVTRPPFSMQVDGADTGFSLDLWAAIAEDLSLDYDIRRYDSFPDMLAAIEAGEADAAVANISITAERETRMDFSQPIFSAGVQVVLPPDGGTFAMLRAALSPRLIGLVALAIVGLLVLGMVMWLLERRRHDYFGPDAKSAAFPAFWWALNLLISGDYGEKTPASPVGRAFGVAMVICSLFVVSLFVANITANLTLSALSSDIERITDLDGRQVGTTEGSTTSDYLNARGVSHRTYPTLDALVDAFEAGTVEAVAFDGPVLAYYVANEGQGKGRLIDRVFQREYYGIALPTGSTLREDINRTILRIEEDGTYADIQRSWFGAVYSER